MGIMWAVIVSFLQDGAGKIAGIVGAGILVLLAAYSLYSAGYNRAETEGELEITRLRLRYEQQYAASLIEMTGKIKNQVSVAEAVQKQFDAEKKDHAQNKEALASALRSGNIARRQEGGGPAGEQAGVHPRGSDGESGAGRAGERHLDMRHTFSPAFVSMFNQAIGASAAAADVSGADNPSGPAGTAGAGESVPGRE